MLFAHQKKCWPTGSVARTRNKRYDTGMVVRKLMMKSGSSLHQRGQPSPPSNDTLAKKWQAGGIHSILALILVWDQFSRVLWRGDGRAFINDDRAGDLAMKTILSGMATDLDQQELTFLKMPLLHSESIDIQEWNSKQPGGESDHIQGHLGVIQKFGRFPKRNVALGRISTPEEIEYMAAPEVQGRPY